MWFAFKERCTGTTWKRDNFNSLFLTNFTRKRKKCWTSVQDYYQTQDSSSYLLKFNDILTPKQSISPQMTSRGDTFTVIHRRSNNNNKKWFFKLNEVEASFYVCLEKELKNSHNSSLVEILSIFQILSKLSDA